MRPLPPDVERKYDHRVGEHARLFTPGGREWDDAGAKSLITPFQPVALQWSSFEGPGYADRMTFKKDCVLDVAFANIEGATFSFVAANERNRGRSYPLTSDGAPEIVVEVESDESTPVRAR